jgi:hypothetical protein
MKIHSLLLKVRHNRVKYSFKKHDIAPTNDKGTAYKSSDTPKPCFKIENTFIGDQQ